MTRVRIWYEGLDGLNKAGVWAAALFALYFLSIIMGGSRRGYAPPRRRTYERDYDDYRPSYYGGGGQGLGAVGQPPVQVASAQAEKTSQLRPQIKAISKKRLDRIPHRRCHQPNPLQTLNLGGWQHWPP